MNKHFIINLIALQLLKPGDEVFLEDPVNFPECTNIGAPKGWVRVAAARLTSDGYLPITHPKGFRYEVFPYRITDWKPAKERVDGAADPEVR